MSYTADQRVPAASYWQKIANWAAPLFQKKFCIIGPRADALIIYGSPLLGVLVLLSLSNTGLWYTIAAFNYEEGILSFVCGVLTTAHLLAVGFRSHLNKEVFNRWPLRFTVIPVLLFVALSANLWFLVIASVVAVIWDAYHAGMQNFGLARIYDMRMGNDAHAGRLLDSMMNQVLYAGPLLAGVTLAFHVDSINNFAEVGAAALTTLPQNVMGHAQLIRWIVIPVCLLICAIYVIGYWRLAKKGYQISPQKVLLMLSMGVASIISWGFNPFATAFAAMNVYHAIQYFGILYAREGNAIAKTCKIDRAPPKLKPWLIIAILLVPTCAYGIWEMLATPGWDRVFALILTVTLLHYWYDGFIWSVRKKQV